MRAIIPLTVTFTMALAALPVFAEELPVPEADSLLTVSGHISRTNVQDTAQFDLEMLKAMTVTTVTTTTIWTEGEQVFEGVPLAALLVAVGAEGTTVLASAINDYTVEIPVDSITEDVPIVAFSQNGEEMSRRQKGPLWIIYPYDSDPEYQTEVVYSRSIWQLDRIELAK